MTSKFLKRLAKDHTSLHTSDLPPNYLFAPGKEEDFSDLTSLSILLAGPQGTPFKNGVFALELSIPTTYPAVAPTAHFKTKMFHPNIDPATGAVCVETLKRDWKPELTLRDILITISCLLIYPNPASALNAEAGRLIEVDFQEYERKARLWAQMHASIPASLQAAVREAQHRGNEEPVLEPAEPRRLKGRRDKKPESEPVFVREDSMPRGLGIDLPESSNAHVETPTQAPAPSKTRREKLTADPTSTAPVTTMPVPKHRPLIHSNPSTPRMEQPAAKRPRLTPTGEKENTQEPAASWLDWQSRSPFSSPELEARRNRRKIVEEEKLRSIGGSLEEWNKGAFGPRTGIERL